MSFRGRQRSVRREPVQCQLSADWSKPGRRLFLEALESLEHETELTAFTSPILLDSDIRVRRLPLSNGK